MSDEKEEKTPASGTLEQRIAEVRARESAATPGPWIVWDGPDYSGGGRDLCIGVGGTWLANMDHRECSRRVEHMEAYSGCKAREDSDICSLDGNITKEQDGNAHFIARAREDIPFLLRVIEQLDQEIERQRDEMDRLRGLE